MVVIEPAPAMSGNAIGNMDTPAPCELYLNNSMPSIISIAIRNIINDPAIANDETSMPKIPKRGLPTRRKETKIAKEAIVTFNGLILFDLDLMSSITGIAPGISIIAKSTMKAATVSIKFKCISKIFDKNNHLQEIKQA